MSSATPPRLNTPTRRGATQAAAVVLGMAVLAAGSAAHGQTGAASAPKAPAAKVQKATKPEWSQLTSAQQAALAPLSSGWAGISEGQKRKWIALSQNYPSLSAAERSKLHGRMTDWAALSAEQRNRARLNFAQTKGLTTEEKKARWQAYQALSPDQKKKLAQGAQPVTAGAAPAVTPVAPNKLAAVPITRSEAGSATPAPEAHAGHTGTPGPKAAASATARP